MTTAQKWTSLRQVPAIECLAAEAQQLHLINATMILTLYEHECLDKDLQVRQSASTARHTSPETGGRT